jgi:hypothetical protein
MSHSHLAANNVFVERDHFWDLGFISDETYYSLQQAPSYRGFWADSTAPLGTRGFSVTLQEMPLQ